MEATKRKRLLFLLALLVGAVVLALITRLCSPGNTSGDEREAGQETAQGAPGGVTGPSGSAAGGAKKAPQGRIDYVFDVSDDKRLVGYADAVFVGEVKDQSGERPQQIPKLKGQTLPQLQFSVKVDQVIKGEDEPKGVKSGETVTVNQRGGVDPKTGKPVVMESDGGGGSAGGSTGGGAKGGEDFGPLKTGATYLFCTRYDESEGWHNIAAQPFGNRLLADDKQRDQATEQFRQAAKEQVDPLKELTAASGR